MPATTVNDIVINAPIDLVWRITNDVAGWPQLYSEYAEANILERTGATVVFELVMHPDENGTVWRWVSQRTADESTHTVKAHRVETGPFEYMNIVWEYGERGPTSTLMRWRQDFAMRPTAPVDDATMAARINANTPVQMGLIKDKVEAAFSARAAGAVSC
jgi:aromatase